MLRKVFILIFLSAVFSVIWYDSVNNIIWITGTNGGNPWTPEDVYQTCINQNWGVCEKYFDGERPVYIFNAGIRIGDGTTYTEFSAQECSIVVDPNFITFSNSKVIFGRKNDRGSGYLGVTLIAKSYNTNNVPPMGDPSDWYCVYFNGEAYVYGSTLVCQQAGCVTFSTHNDTTPQVVMDSLLSAAGIRLNSGNLSLIRVYMEQKGTGDGFAEFADAPREIKNLHITSFYYYISFYRQTGKISVQGLHVYGTLNAISLPDRTNQYQEIIDMDPLQDPTQLEVLRGWNMENATVDYKFTLKLRIVDENENPISNARVQIIDAKGNVIYDNFTSSEFNITLTSYRAIVKSYQDSTADVSYQPIGVGWAPGESWWWNVWIYTPFTIKVFRYGYKPFVTTIDLKRRTNLLVILEKDPIIEELGINEVTASSLPISCSLSSTGIYHCNITVSGTTFTETSPFDLRYFYAWTRAQYDEGLFRVIESPEVGVWVLRNLQLNLKTGVNWKEKDVTIKYIINTNWDSSIDGDYIFYVSNDAKVVFGSLISQDPIRTANGVTFYLEPDNETQVGDYENLIVFELDPAGEMDFYSSKVILLPEKKNLIFAYGGIQKFYYSTIDRLKSSGTNSVDGLYYRTTFTNTVTSLENPGAEIKEITVSGSDYGISLSQGWLGEASDIKIDPSVAGFYLDSFFGEINLTNFETTNFSRYWTGNSTKNTGTIRILYDLTIKVVDYQNNPVSNALVIVKNSENETVFEGYTDADGRVKTKVISYEIIGDGSTGINADTFKNYNPFTITVYKQGFATISLTTNVTSKTLFVFPMINKSQIVQYDLCILAPSFAGPSKSVLVKVLVKNTGTIGGETRLIISANDTTNYYDVQQFYLDPGEQKTIEFYIKMPKEYDSVVVVNATAIPIGAPGVDAYAEKRITVARVTAPTLIPILMFSGLLLWVAVRIR